MPTDPASNGRDHSDGVRPHLAMRPLWLCRSCGGPWPCATARLTLTTEYDHDRASLCIYLAGMLHEAMHDLYRLNPHDAPAPAVLFGRFLDWAKPRPRS